MVLTAMQFTPEVLLSAPRRAPAVPNCRGDKALYTVTAYSFKTHRKTSQVRVLDIKSGNSAVLYEDSNYSEPTWVDHDDFLMFKSGEGGKTLLVSASVSSSGVEPKVIRSFNGSLSNLKIKRLANGTIALACTALASPDGNLYTPQGEKKPYSSGKVFTKLFVRHWDSYVTENTQSIWYTSIQARGKGVYSLSEPGLINALAKTGLQSPVPPFGGASDFDIGSKGIVFVSRDPELIPALNTKSDVYYIPIDSWTQTKPPTPQRVKTGDLKGYSGNPVFSPDGKSIVFTKMRHQQYESDKTRLMLVTNVDDLSGDAQEFYKTENGEGGWDARPEGIVWSADSKELYVTAEHHGRGALWRLPSSPSRAKELPEQLTKEGTVIDFKLLSDGGSKLFVTTSSLVDNSAYSILDPTSKALELVSSNSKQGKTFGLSKSQFDETWFRGAGDYDVHALIMKPSDFDPKKRYPLAFLIHGGPQGAWGDSWSTRWNPAIFAEQGFIAIAPNPTGSTGYGMALEDGIQNHWGGRPYEDLVKCFEHIEKNIPYVDTSRAVALGASYGGYMINWIQGHPLGRKFKALVCHDGVFSTLNQYSSEELFFPLHDFGGTLWENREGYEKWDPARFTSEWATPQLIIHNELDYRLPVTEGLSAFNVLQSRGVPSKFLMFPDENHWVLKPENSLVWHREVLDWINKYAENEDRASRVTVYPRAEKRT